MFQNSHVGGAKSYYSTADYYSEGQELTGRWRGEAARKLGLSGNVQQNEWDALCDNVHPKTGEQLTARMRNDRTVGYDLNFHVPKSVSLLYAMTKDERILDAFRRAVDGTMHDIESEMATRVRKRGKNEDRRTGNMAWGEFVHFTSRPVEGIPDPHLHAHCFVFNTTWDEREKSWKAGQFRNLMRDAPYFEAAFHSELSNRLANLGLPIERTKTGWELQGVDRTLIEKFSRRTAQIEEKAKEKGIDDPEAKAALGAKTRQSKQKDLTFPELQVAWRERFTGEESKALAELERRLGGDAEPVDSNAAGRAVQYAVGHSFERKSVVPERQLLAAALRHSVGKATVEQVRHAASASDLIVGERHGRRMATTRAVLAEERYVIDFARKGRGTCSAFARSHDKFTRDWLNADQKNAVRHIVESRDRVMVVRGAAGVGKTTLMKEAVEAIEAGGTKVIAFAPSAEASHGVLRAAGFANADTVAMLLKSENLQKQVAGQLIWVDEAGQVGMKTMAEIFRLAEKLDCRVLLTGDRRQHGSVERGAALRLIEEEAGLVPAEVKEIQRQKGAYKEAVKDLSEGRVAEGFKRLDELGWVREIAADERYKLLAADYIEAVGEGKTALVISPTHAEAERVTGEIRDALRAAGTLKSGERSVRVLKNMNLTEAERGEAVNFLPGDVLQFHQNTKGITRGQRVSVDGTRPLPLEQAARFNAFRATTLQFAPGDLVRITHTGKTVDRKHTLRNGARYEIDHFDELGNIVLDNGWTVGRDFGHLAHGYVVTSHASQGASVKRVFVGQSSESRPASSREQFYVSMSRATEQVTVYTDDKEALRDAIQQSDERVTATELVSGTRQRRARAMQRFEDIPPERQERERKEIGHER